jgi:hypothetical protein
LLALPNSGVVSPPLSPAKKGKPLLSDFAHIENKLITSTTEQLKKLDRNGITALWVLYDTERKGYMKPTHVSMQLFAAHLVGRIDKMLSDAARENAPKIKAKELEEMIQKERYYMLGGVEKEEQVIPYMVKYMLAKWDSNK